MGLSGLIIKFKVCMNLGEIKQKQSGLYKHRTIVCLLPKAVIIATPSVAMVKEQADVMHARIAKSMGRLHHSLHCRRRVASHPSTSFARMEIPS